jgi:hypothetical protein
MTSHPCLICGKNPTVSADNGSGPMRGARQEVAPLGQLTAHPLLAETA